MFSYCSLYGDKKRTKQVFIYCKKISNHGAMVSMELIAFNPFSKPDEPCESLGSCCANRLPEKAVLKRLSLRLITTS
jgi:hypothetical protein